MNVLRSRFALREDLPRIVEIYNATIPSRIVTADLEPVSVESREAWFHKHNEKLHPLWVFENATGSIVGWASFQAFYARKAYDSCVEISIYLDQATQGKGKGREILEFSIGEAKTRGIRTILGFIFRSNQASMRLFETAGFEVWGNFPEIAEMEDHFEDLVILGKRL